MRYGFIYRTIKFILDYFNYLNLVELFKFIAIGLNKNKSNIELEKTYARVGIDIFICFKWFLVFLFWILDCHSNLVLIFVWYLIITNVYSYFYNHIWTDEALNTESFTKDRIRSRFLNLLLALLFSTFSFGYLYAKSYVSEFSWPNNVAKAIYAIQFSFSNSIAANYDQVKPLTDFGYKIANAQLVITFIFIAIILSKSIPQTNSTT